MIEERFFQIRIVSSEKLVESIDISLTVIRNFLRRSLANIVGRKSSISQVVNQLKRKTPPTEECSSGSVLTQTINKSIGETFIEALHHTASDLYRLDLNYLGNLGMCPWTVIELFSISKTRSSKGYFSDNLKACIILILGRL